MFNFASPSLASYTPLVLLNRYLVPILLPAAVLTAGLLVRLFATPEGAEPQARRERLFWGGLTATALLIACAVVGFSEARDLKRIQPIYQLREVAAHTTPQDVVYADPLSRKALEFFWRYPQSSKLVDLEGLQATDVAPGSYVIVDKTRLQWLNVNVSMWLTKDYGYHAPGFAVARPDDWKPVWRNQSSTLYKVD